MRVKGQTLAEIRGQWEKGLTVLSGKKEHGRCLVVLLDDKHRYSCHRYFRVGIKEDDEWTISVDVLPTDDIRKVIQWVMSPEAMPTGETKPDVEE